MYHQRRKSGNTSTTDIRELSGKSTSKTSRPTAMTRRSSTQTSQKLGRSSREREREWDEDRWFEDERESFPQYCMACEKQFMPQYENLIYCSEECRMYDQEHTSTAAQCFPSLSSYSNKPSSTANYSFYATTTTEPRDIIPRASPSRPQSHFSLPTPPSSSDETSDAIKALRSLSIRPPSPPTPSSTYHPYIWPFTKSGAVSPASSYTRPSSGVFSSTYDSSTYDGGYYGASGYGMTSPTTDRPLPSRRPGGSHSRPRSIDLVTPMVGGH